MMNYEGPGRKRSGICAQSEEEHDLRAEIWTQDLPIKKQEFYPSDRCARQHRSLTRSWRQSHPPPILKHIDIRHKSLISLFHVAVERFVVRIFPISFFSGNKGQNVGRSRMTSLVCRYFNLIQFRRINFYNDMQVKAYRLPFGCTVISQTVGRDSKTRNTKIENKD
jgi:hypothetical protein